MILATTYRKLAASGSSVFRVTFPSYTTPFAGYVFPERIEYFATRSQAEKQAREFDMLASMTKTPRAAIACVSVAEAMRADPFISALYDVDAAVAAWGGAPASRSHVRSNGQPLDTEE